MSASTRSQRTAKEQLFQDAEYAFPYHYVSQYSGGFRNAFHDSWGIHYVSTIEYLLSRLGEFERQSVLDVGCGDGRMCREISLRFPDRRVAGVDFSERAIALAKAMNFGCGRLEFEARDITVGVPVQKHDVVVMMEVLEHVPIGFSAGFLAAVASELMGGGYLLLTVPHENKAVEYKHFRHFNSSTLKRLLEPQFEVVEMVPFERRSVALVLIQMVLSNRYVLIQHQRFLNAIYYYYKRHLFNCRSELHCQRLFVLARVKARPL